MVSPVRARVHIMGTPGFPRSAHDAYTQFYWESTSRSPSRVDTKLIISPNTLKLIVFFLIMLIDEFHSFEGRQIRKRAPQWKRTSCYSLWVCTRVGIRSALPPKDSTNVSEVVDWEFLAITHVPTQFSKFHHDYHQRLPHASAHRAYRAFRRFYQHRSRHPGQ